MTDQQIPGQVNPKYINDPKPGKTNYSIKDAEGNRWSVPPKLIHLFGQGKITPVTYVLWGDGLRMVQAADAPQAPAKAPQPAAAYAPPLPAAPQAPAAAPNHIQDTAEEIYLTGVVGRTMAGLAQSGNYTVDELVEAMSKLTNRAIWAWRNREAG